MTKLCRWKWKSINRLWGLNCNNLTNEIGVSNTKTVATNKDVKNDHFDGFLVTASIYLPAFTTDTITQAKHTLDINNTTICIKRNTTHGYGQWPVTSCQ